MAIIPKGKDLFLAIDANAIVHRAYHAFPDGLVNSKGIQVNAVFGFTSMLLNVLSEYTPKYIVCAFDTKKPTFRHSDFADYKAHRKPTDQSLLDQMPLVEEVLNAFNIPILKREGFEADDILGDLAYRIKRGKWSDYDMDMLILSGDKDLLQLIGENVYVCLPVGSFKNLLIYDTKETVEKIGVRPDQIVDLKGLVGDPSDNIPGVKGIGMKGAVGMLNKYGSIDSIYQNLDQLPPRQAKLLLEGVEQMELSRQLAKIVDRIDEPVQLAECLMTDFDRTEVLRLFNEMEFRTLVSRIPTQGSSKEQVAGQLGLFGVGTTLEGAIPEGDNSTNDAYTPMGYIEAVSLSGGQITGEFNRALSSDRSLLIYLSDSNSQGSGELFIGHVDNLGEYFLAKVGLTRETVQLLADGFTGRADHETCMIGWEALCRDITHHDLNALDKLKVNIFDLQLVAHLLSSGDKDFELSRLIFKYLGKELPEISFGDKGINGIEVYFELYRKLSDELDSLGQGDFAREKAENIGRSSKVMRDAYYDYEQRLSVVLGKMESKGIMMDINGLEYVGKELTDEISKVESEIYHDIGHEVNLNSPKQLAEVLYDELALPHGRGKSGRSTREEVLKKLSPAHPAIEKLLKYRELSKMNGTYVKPLIDFAKNSEHGVIHTDFLQTGASSGRLASKDPNLQNLPLKGEWSTKIRRNFISRKGSKFLALDYSQIELRIFADMSSDRILLEDFLDGKDIHRATAARIFGKDVADVQPKERALGKTINFGILYGQSKYGLASMLDISVDEAGEYINEYFDHYEGVREYLTKVQSTALEKGYVETMLGRRRYIGGLNANNQQVVNSSIREAINMPIQGTAADIMKIAMVQIDRYINESMKEKVFMLLQIHDELVFEVEEAELDMAEEEISKIMRECVNLKVPLLVNASRGDDLSQLK